MKSPRTRANVAHFPVLCQCAAIAVLIVILLAIPAFAATYIDGRELGSIERERIIKELDALQDDVEDLKAFPWTPTILCAVIAGVLSALLVSLPKLLKWSETTRKPEPEILSQNSETQAEPSDSE